MYAWSSLIFRLSFRGEIKWFQEVLQGTPEDQQEGHHLCQGELAVLVLQLGQEGLLGPVAAAGGVAAGGVAAVEVDQGEVDQGEVDQGEVDRGGLCRQNQRYYLG